MEFKTIVYLILGVAYFAYSAYKNAKTKEVEKPKHSSKPAAPKPKNWLDEAIEKMQQEAEKAKQQAQPRAKPFQQPKPAASKQSRNLARETLVREVSSHQPFEEGEFAGATYERPLTAEEILHNERMRAAQNIEIVAVEEETSSINAREAFIGSLIFERKF